MDRKKIERDEHQASMRAGEDIAPVFTTNQPAKAKKTWR